MADFLFNFYSGADQVVALASAPAAWAGFSALGGLAAGSRRMAEADPFVGWAVVALILTALGVAADVPFRWPAWAIAAGGAVAAVVLRRRDGRIFSEAALRVFVLGLPMLVVISAMSASQWGEFSHWLPSARYLFATDGFPDAADPVTGATYPAYPYGWSLITYLASRLAGQFVETAGAVTNVLILLTFGTVAVRVFRLGLGLDDGSRTGWAVCALGGLAATAFNPTFVQKVALTAYADVATAAAVGIGGVLGWRLLGAVADGTPGVRNLAVQFGMVMAVLVNLKQATFVLFVLLVMSIAFVAVVDGRLRARWRDLIAAAPWTVVPPLIIYGLWRYHVATELAGAEFTLRPPSEWFVDLVPQILATMAVVLAKKGGYLAMMMIAVVVVVRGVFVGRGPLDRLAVITAAMFVTYNAFLLLMYVAAFDRADALRAASLWRYNMHLGLLGVAFAAYAAAVAWGRYGPRRASPRLVGGLAIALMLVAPVVFAGKLRFDRDPGYRHYRAVGAESARLIAPTGTYFVLDPEGTGESALIVRYEVGRPGAMLGYVSAFQDMDASSLAAMLRKWSPDNLVVMSTSSDVQGAVGVALDAGRSYLLAGEDGSWRILRTWPRPGDR